MRFVPSVFATGFALAASLFAGEFTLHSNDLEGQLTKTQEYSGFGCSGANISPELHWSNAPEGTKSYAVTVYDPDAPTGSGWWHWVVYDIPASAKGLPADFGNTAKKQAIPAVQGMTDYGKPGFGGACPPKGDKPHRYFFTVHALDVAELGADAQASAAKIGFMINAHSLAKATILSYYRR